MKDRLPEIIYYGFALIVLGVLVYVYKESEDLTVILGLAFYPFILSFVIADQITVYRKEILPSFSWKIKVNASLS